MSGRHESTYTPPILIAHRLGSEVSPRRTQGASDGWASATITKEEDLSAEESSDDGAAVSWSASERGTEGKGISGREPEEVSLNCKVTLLAEERSSKIRVPGSRIRASSSTRCLSFIYRS